LPSLEAVQVPWHAGVFSSIHPHSTFIPLGAVGACVSDRTLNVTALLFPEAVATLSSFAPTVAFDATLNHAVIDDVLVTITFTAVIPAGVITVVAPGRKFVPLNATVNPWFGKAPVGLTEDNVGGGRTVNVLLLLGPDTV
jgi:hypothetical protein